MKCTPKNALVLLILSCQILYAEEPSTWLDSLRDSHLVLPQHQIIKLKDDPQAYLEQRKDLALKYDLIRQKIDMKRKTLYQQQSVGSNQDRVIAEAEQILIQSIESVLIPLWVGTSWDFNGVPGDKPDLDHPIACGHFIQKIMKDVGFNLVRNGSTQMAYLSTKHWVQSLTGEIPVNYGSWDGILAKFKAEGPGLYVMGIDVTSGWGHMLFARYNGTEDVLLLHAGIHPGGASMHLDEGKYYLDDFLDLQNVWLARFDAKLVETW